MYHIEMFITTHPLVSDVQVVYGEYMATYFVCGIASIVHQVIEMVCLLRMYED